jgi:hypothetical protein
MQENGWKPRWFDRDTKDGTFRLTGGYLEAREQRCGMAVSDIFGELSNNLTSAVLPIVDSSTMHPFLPPLVPVGVSMKRNNM